MILADCQNFVTTRSHNKTNDSSASGSSLPLAPASIPPSPSRKKSCASKTRGNRIKVEDQTAVDMRNSDVGQLRAKLIEVAGKLHFICYFLSQIHAGRAGLMISSPFRWKKLAWWAGKQGYVLMNYPNNVRLPHESCSEKTSKGIENLTVHERALFMAQITDAQHPFEFRKVQKGDSMLLVLPYD